METRGISSQLHIDVPKSVQEILGILKAHGHEAYIVGGCVRDALLGRQPGDWDITTSALPGEVKGLFSNTVDTGIQHGTVMVIRGGEGYEVTTYRIDGEYKDSRHPADVTFTRSLEEDLKRRDFTINAFAWDEDGLIDLFDGLKDLEDGVIRCVGDPDRRFDEDALRIMRAVRFSAQLGFMIEPGTEAMIMKYAPRLSQISMERIRVEWEKTLLSGHPCLVNDYARLEMAPFIIPAFWEKCFDTDKNSLLEEINLRVNKSEVLNRLLRMAVFFGNLLPEEANQVLRAMKYDNHTRTEVVKILKYQSLEGLQEGQLRSAIKQELNRMGADTFAAILELWDVRLSTGVTDQREWLNHVTMETRDILESGEAWSIPQLAVSGSDLIAAGVPKGKKIGDFLEKILQKVIQSPTLNNRANLLSDEFLAEVEYECERGI